MPVNRKIIEVLNCNLNMELSLTSRELYHSNFIAYMIKNNPDVPLMFLKDFIDVDKVKIKKVEREKKHIDITLYLTDGTKVLIENKMKDYPKREQLERYSQKNPDAHLKVLLVPFKINKSVLPSDWNIIHYSNIVEYLDLIKENKFTPFIEDYKELCINLEMLFNSANPDPSTSTYGEVYELMKTVENLNLDSAIERIYRNSLLDEISSEFKPYSGRSNGHMYFGGLVWLDKNLSIDVQVQKYQYRHKLNIPRKLVRDNAFKMVNELKNLNLVFNFNNCLEVKKGQEWNQYGLGKLDKTFDIYNSSLKLKENARGLDIYTYAKIPDDLQNLKVIELVNSDLQFLDENKAKILEIINKYLNE